MSTLNTGLYKVLAEAILMRVNHISLYEERAKIIFQLSQNIEYASLQNIKYALNLFF